MRSAAGVDESRGDVVEVVSRPFAGAAPPAEPEPEAGWQETLAGAYGRLVELGVLSVLTLVVLFFGVRPALRRLLAAVQPPTAARHAPRSCWARMASRCWSTAPPAPPSGSTGPATRSWSASRSRPRRRRRRLGHGEAGAAGELVDLKHVHGPVQASLLGQVTRAIDANPEDAVRVIRGWLHGG